VPEGSPARPGWYILNATHSHSRPPADPERQGRVLLPMPDDTVRLLSSAESAGRVPPAGVAQSLADLPLGVCAHVVGMRPAEPSREARELALRLLEIGFIDGEPVRVIAQGHPGREPIAVRVGGTTFALRRFEAEQVLVTAIATEHEGA
jgi:ferrous iron transport protein A